MDSNLIPLFQVYWVTVTVHNVVISNLSRIGPKIYLLFYKTFLIRRNFFTKYFTTFKAVIQISLFLLTQLVCVLYKVLISFHFFLQVCVIEPLSCLSAWITKSFLSSLNRTESQPLTVKETGSYNKLVQFKKIFNF